MRRGQHPLHPAIVHFPIACWVLVSLSDAIYIVGSNEIWLERAQLLLTTGLISAVAAMAIGFFDSKQAKAPSPQLLRTLERHVIFMSCAWCVYLISWVCRQQYIHKPGLELDGEFVFAWFIAATSSAAIGCALLLVGAWFGAELVYKHGVGNHHADNN